MKDLKKHIVSIFIILLATSPAFALGIGNRNLLLIGSMFLSPVFYLKYHMMIPKIDSKMIILCSLMILFPLIYHPETMRWSTVLYGILFCAYFGAYIRTLKSNEYFPEDLSKVLKGLIYAYCIVLLIQQFCVLFRLPIFNVSNYSVTDPWKLNSLMSESSHSGRVLPLLMYVYLSIKELKHGKLKLSESLRSDKLLWCAFIYTSIGIFSATAYIYMLIVFAKFLNRKNIITISLIVLTGTFLVSLTGAIKPLQRTLDAIEATLTFDENNIIKADGSGAYRIVPFFRGIKAVGFSSVDDYFGHGIDADARDIAPLPGTNTGAAGPFSIWYNYGLIIQLIYWFLTFGLCYIKQDKVSLLVWFLFVFSYGGINNQMVWLAICLMYTYKYYFMSEQNALSGNSIILKI